MFYPIYIPNNVANLNSTDPILYPAIKSYIQTTSQRFLNQVEAYYSNFKIHKNYLKNIALKISASRISDDMSCNTLFAFTYNTIFNVSYQPKYKELTCINWKKATITTTKKVSVRTEKPITKTSLLTVANIHARFYYHNNKQTKIYCIVI